MLTNNSNSINIGTETIGGGLGMENKFCLIYIICFLIIAGLYTKESGTLAYFEVNNLEYFIIIHTIYRFVKN
jgi:hypothetical protein